MCPNTCFLITCTDKRCVLFESCGPVPNSITKTICCIVLLCCHATLLSPPPVLLAIARLSAAPGCSDCQKNESILSTWKLIFFATSSVNLLSCESKQKNPVFVEGRWGAGMVFVSERGLGPGHPDIHRNCWGQKWAGWDTPMSHASPSGRVCPAWQLRWE